MTGAPRLLAGKRRWLAAILAVLALGEAMLAVLFAAVLDLLLADGATPLEPLLAASGIAAMSGLTVLLGRWMGEGFAQGYVTDCRASLFQAVTRQPVGSTDARWLTGLINDMAALRNYALRGTVRLWTSIMAAGAAAAWVLVTMPQVRIGLVPLAVGAGVIGLLAWQLSHAVTAQRTQRGRLNRFLVRRVRVELAGEPSTKGHGFRKLDGLSSHLARAAVRRALWAGAMDAVAAIAGLAAALILVWQTAGSQDIAGLAGSLTLLGFIAARLLECARALHARIGGRIALRRLVALVAPEQARASPRLR